MDTEENWLAKLTELYSGERSSAAAIEQMVRNARSDDTKMVLMVSLAMHSTRVMHLREFLDANKCAPDEAVKLPERLQTMLTKKNVPEKLMFGWLNELEGRLLEHYENMKANFPNRQEQLYFATMRNDQKGLVEKLSTFSQKLTAVVDPSLWE